ncbi:MAG: hypothetical protein Q4G19_07070 [Clostridia bacterium]|nr:hypothetical protein [Clostridia bacterium]
MKKRKIDPRIIGLALLCLLVSAAAAVLVTFIQNSCTFADISNDLSRELDILCENYKRTLPVKQSSDEYNARFGEEFVQLISEILLQGGEDTFSDETLQQLCRDLEAENLVIIDEDGYVLYQAHTANADFTWDRFRQLRCSSGTRESAEGVRVITDEQAYLYYSCPLGSGKYVVLTASAEKLDKANEESFGWANLLHNAHIGIDGFTMVGSLQDYTVVWAEDEQLIGQNTFLTFHTIQDDERVNQNGILTISVSGREYYSMTRVIPDTTLMLMTCIPKSEVRALILPTVFFIILIFTLAAALIVSFCYIRSREKNISSVRILRRKMIPGTLVTAAVLIVLTFYLQTLNLLSTGMMQNENNVSGISNTIREYEIIQERITERSDYCTNSIAQTVAYALNRFPELISTDGLSGLADIIDCEEIRVFDADGRTAASSHGRDSLVLSTDPDSRSGEFRRLLQGVETYCQPAAPDDSGELYQIAGAALKDENGDNSGLVWIVIRPQQLISARTNWSYESVLENFAATGDTFAFAADKLDKVFTWFPSEYLIGKDALEYGLTDSNFRDSFNGFLMLDGTKYLGSCDENDTRCYFVVTSRADVYSKRLGNVLLNIAVIILMLLVLLLAAPQISAGDRTEDGRTAEKTLPGITAAEPWKTSEKGRKTIAVLSNVFIIFTVVVSLLYIFRNSLLSKNSVIRFVFDARWEKGLNIFP